MGSDTMEFIYLVCFFLGFGFAVLCALLAGVFSGHAGAHFDAGGHAEAGGSHSMGGHEGGEGNVHYSPLSPVTIALFISTFGGIGILLKWSGFSALIQLPAAVGSGVAVAGLVSYAFYRIMRSTQASSHGRANEAIGAEAEVTVPIPHQGLGEVAYTLRGARLTNPAKTADGKELGAQTVVKIIQQVGTTFIVQKSSK